jgi:hypothetical protein
VLFKQLFETHPRIIEDSEAAYTVAMLQEMFYQIDYNGDGECLCVYVYGGLEHCSCCGLHRVSTSVTERRSGGYAVLVPGQCGWKTQL